MPGPGHVLESRAWGTCEDKAPTRRAAPVLGGWVGEARGRASDRGHSACRAWLWPSCGDPEAGGRPYTESVRAFGGHLGPGGRGGSGCRVGVRGQGGTLST